VPAFRASGVLQQNSSSLVKVIELVEIFWAQKYKDFGLFGE